LAGDNAAYALALINGGDLRPWHLRPAWKAKEEVAGRSPAVILTPKELAILRMAQTARDTVAGANNQQVFRTIKNKVLRFDGQNFS
jgi:hypothetical protein